MTEQIDTQALEKRVNTFSRDAITVSTPEQEQTAASELADIDALIGEVKGTFEKPVKAAWDAARSISALRDKFLGPLELARDIRRRALGKYRVKVRAEAAIAQAEAHTEAKQEAEYLRSIGHEDAAASVEASVPAVTAPPPPNGIGSRINYRVTEVYSLTDLVKAAAEGKAPVDCLQPNMTFLNSLASQRKGLLNIPGVRVEAVGTITRRKK